MKIFKTFVKKKNIKVIYFNLLGIASLPWLASVLLKWKHFPKSSLISMNPCIFIPIITSKFNVFYSLTTLAICSHIHKIIFTYLRTFSSLLCLVYLLPVIIIYWNSSKSHICFWCFLLFFNAFIYSVSEGWVKYVK